MNKKIRIIFVSLLMSACSPLSESIWAPPAQLPPGTPLTLNLKPGTFIGVAPSFHYEITVAVTVDESRILDIQVLEHHDTPGFAYRVFETMIPDIIKFNSTGVDIVTSSTVTSRAVIEAVEEAMYQAGANISVLRTFNPPVEPGNFEPGIYSVVGTGGFGGNIYADVTFDEHWIKNIQVTSHSESPGFADSVMNHLIERILTLQHTNIDIITDATITTNAFLNAVQNAIETATIDVVTEATTGATEHSNYESDYALEENYSLYEETEYYEQPIEESVEQITEQPILPELPPYVPEESQSESQIELEPQPEPQVPIGRFTPGTFTGVGTGFYGSGTVSVTITVDENNITNITMSSSDTEDFVDMVRTPMINLAMARQNAPVDIVSGATATANGFNQALQSAINQAEH